jgi:3-hydroxyisobutyrate dehydrogenase-like beta-hydroxyacid dehydrogenase
MTHGPDVVGLIGLGQMGGAMARTLPRSDRLVVAFTARYNLEETAAPAELSAATGIEVPIFEAAAGHIQALVEAGGGGLDHSAIVTMIERAATGEGDP